jgi:serine/threonine protein kinase
MQPRIPEVTLLEELGRGEGGIVYRALHRGMRCLVKLPKSSFIGPSLAEHAAAFEHDLLLLARLSRAGLPRVVQVAATAETPYAILDELHGQSLARLLAGPLCEADALRIAFTLSGSLQELHEAGFIHGSLSPDTILISDGGTRIGLVDHGSISRPLSFDPRTDQHALGSVLRECAKRMDVGATPRVVMLRVAEELLGSSRVDLGWVMGELEPHTDLGPRRSSSFPPPSRDSLLAPILPAAHVRRARSELSRLQRSWDHAQQHGGKIIELLGPPGSGKTRLLSAFAALIGEDDVQVLSVKCRDSDWEPFSALKRLLDGHLAGLSSLEPERRAQIEQSLRAAAGPMSSVRVPTRCRRAMLSRSSSRAWPTSSRSISSRPAPPPSSSTTSIGSMPVVEWSCPGWQAGCVLSGTCWYIAPATTRTAGSRSSVFGRCSCPSTSRRFSWVS